MMQPARLIDDCPFCGDRAGIVYSKFAMTLLDEVRDLTVQVAQLRFDLNAATENSRKICKALSDLYDACMQADGEGELYYTIDGDLLDAARKAMRDET